MLTTDQIITGIPVWLVAQYIEDIGGQLRPDGWLHGDGWRIRLTQTDDRVLGVLRIGQVRLEIAGDEESIERMRPALEKKLLRAGG